VGGDHLADQLLEKRPLGVEYPPVPNFHRAFPRPAG
jgi:hypothetical protein